MEAKPVFALSGRAVLLRDRRRQENCLRGGGENQRAAFIGTGKQRRDAAYREKPQAQGDARGAGAMPDLQYHYPFPAGKNAHSGRVPASSARLLSGEESGA